MTELAIRTRQVAEDFDDGFAFDRNRLIYKFRTSRESTNRGLFDMGCALVVLKENVPHGEWTELLEGQLDIHPRAARRLMAMAIKYRRGTKRDKLSVLGQTKLLELIDEPDDDLDALADGGTLHGMTLDEVQCLTNRELRERLQEKERREQALEKRAAVLEAQVREMKDAEDQRQFAGPSEREQFQLAELETKGRAAELAIRQLVKSVSQVLANPASGAAAHEARATLQFPFTVAADLFAQERFGGFDILGQRVEPGWRREEKDLAAAVAEQSAPRPKGAGKR